MTHGYQRWLGKSPITIGYLKIENSSSAHHFAASTQFLREKKKDTRIHNCVRANSVSSVNNYTQFQIRVQIDHFIHTHILKRIVICSPKKRALQQAIYTQLGLLAILANYFLGTEANYFLIIHKQIIHLHIRISQQKCLDRVLVQRCYKDSSWQNVKSYSLVNSQLIQMQKSSFHNMTCKQLQNLCCHILFSYCLSKIKVNH